MRQRSLLVILAGFLFTGLSASPAHADILVIEYNEVYNGGLSGTGPFLRATFADDAATGSVTLTLDALNLPGTTFASEWYFNLNPAYNVSSLTATALDVSDVTGWSFAKSTNGLSANGTGSYDFRISLSSASTDDKFTLGDSVAYQLGGITNLRALDFNFLATVGGDNGVHLSAARIGGLGAMGRGTAWVGAPIPEPASLTLLGLGLGGLYARRRAAARRGHPQP